MSEELKTLKDIYTGFSNEEGRLIPENRLKQEVIKILNSDTKDLCKFIGVGALTQENLMIIDLLLRKVFNITQEDLK